MQANTPSASSVRTIAGVCARGILVIGLIVAVDHAFAGGKVYRCGNAFQDQPCATETAPAAKVAARDTVPAASVPRPEARSSGSNDRLVVEPSRALTVDVRR